MRTIQNRENFEKISLNGVTVPASLSPKKIIYSTETENFMSFISSQHPLINVWLIFSLISIGILSILLYTL